MCDINKQQHIICNVLFSDNNKIHHMKMCVFGKGQISDNE